MKQIELGIVFFIATLLAAICSITLLFIDHNETIVTLGCEAIAQEDNELAKQYIDRAINIDGVGNNKQTMLMTACDVGNSEMIIYLLNSGADANKTMPGHPTPLELFCQNGYNAGKRTLEILIRNGAKQKEYTIKPALFHLADNFYWMNDEQKKEATEEAILLLQNGAPLEYDGTSLLHIAAKSDMSDLFYTIVHTSQGLQLLTKQDTDGMTPWQVAVKNGSIDVQRVIRNLETEFEEEQNENTQQTDPIEPPSSDDLENEQLPTVDAPLGSIDNPYPDGYFDNIMP
jgi:ankyrin repeat protein